MIPDHIFDLCRNQLSVSDELAKDPSASAASVCKKLYGRHIVEENLSEKDIGTVSAGDLEKAHACGRWGNTQPSELFLKIFADVLATLKKDALGGVCSPSLMGTNGVCPLAVISTIPDICRHMSNMIARAEHEVFLATNYWMLSEPSRLISESIRELNRRCAESGRKAVIKVLYDRGSVKQLIDNHQVVPEKVYADVKGPIALPRPEEIPNIHLEVVNFHKPALGTFHAKFMVVDRRTAIIQSNNIMDNDNMEMMSQFEGDIVDSVYDMALIAWSNAMKPPLPCLNSPARQAPAPTPEIGSFASLFDTNGDLTSYHQQSNGNAPTSDNLQKVATKASQMNLEQHTSQSPQYDPDIATEVLRAISALNPRPGSTRIESISQLLNSSSGHNAKASAPEVSPYEMLTPIIPIRPHAPFPIAMVNRPPHGAPTNHSIHVPQNQSWISALRYAKSTVFIQTPDLNAHNLLPEILSACRRGIQVTYYYCLGYNDAGELLPGQGGHNEMVANNLYKSLEREFHPNLNIHAYIAKDQIHPIHNKFKQRSCHIKLMIVDGHIGIQGSGNQDAQSWYHSQEVNVMIDSALVCGQWTQGIRQNQNTHLYGLVSKEGDKAGCWLHPQTGEMAEGAIGVDPGKFSWARGAMGALNRVRGEGGF